MRVNLNSDLGESFGPWSMGDDEALLDVVGAANVACGAHAGDPLVMRRTAAAALARGVDVGAHPGFPDLQGFGRRPMALAGAELAATVQCQVGALEAVARAAGTVLSHVKPHGALNNLACEDAALAATVADAVAAAWPGLTLLAPARSALAEAGRAAGLPVALEVFADRAYRADGTLVPRREPGAVHATAEACVDQVLAMVERGGIVDVDGALLPTRFHSVCVHGDDPHAVATARAVRAALEAAGHELVGLREAMSVAAPAEAREAAPRG